MSIWKRRETEEERKAREWFAQMEAQQSGSEPSGKGLGEVLSAQMTCPGTASRRVVNAPAASTRPKQKAASFTRAPGRSPSAARRSAEAAASGPAAVSPGRGPPARRRRGRRRIRQRGRHEHRAGPIVMGDGVHIGGQARVTYGNPARHLGNDEHADQEMGE